MYSLSAASIRAARSHAQHTCQFVAGQMLGAHERLATARMVAQKLDPAPLVRYGERGVRSPPLAPTHFGAEKFICKAVEACGRQGVWDERVFWVRTGAEPCHASYRPRCDVNTLPSPMLRSEARLCRVGQGRRLLDGCIPPFLSHLASRNEGFERRAQREGMLGGDVCERMGREESRQPFALFHWQRAEHSCLRHVPCLRGADPREQWMKQVLA